MVLFMLLYYAVIAICALIYWFTIALLYCAGALVLGVLHLFEMWAEHREAAKVPAAHR